MSDKNSSQTNHNIKFLCTETWKDELIQKLRRLELVANDASLNSIDKLRKKVSSEVNELLEWTKEKTQLTDPVDPKRSLQSKLGGRRIGALRRQAIIYDSSNTTPTPPTPKKKRKNEITYDSIPPPSTSNIE